jgi:hypothetical protein
MGALELTLRSKANDAWPVVAEEQPDDGSPPVLTEGEVRLGSDIRDALRRAALDPDGYGALLGEALFTGTVGRAFERARARSGERLRVLLRVEDPELKALRWERLAAPRDGGWVLLARDQRTPFSLYLPSPVDRRYPAFGPHDLRALVLAASPAGVEDYRLAPFDVPVAVAAARTGLGAIPSEVLAATDGAVGPPSLDALCDRITAGRFTLLHLICHGTVTKDGETVLYLAKADGTVDPVTGTRLIRRLNGLQGARGLPHLMFLAACDTARASAETALGGLAQRLVREVGVPAVVAMTDPVTTATARVLAETFYRQLREHGEPDRALVEACAGLGERDDVTVPALFARLGERPLFSQALRRDPTDDEVGAALDRLPTLLAERAPVLLPAFQEQAAIVRRTLGTAPEALVEETRAERKAAQVAIDAICEEAVEVPFAALALGENVPDYDARPPFPGLRAFDATTKEFFFGRDALVEELRQKLAGHPFLAVMGPSGSGKSSLVLAGLVPVLRAAEPAPDVAILKPGNEPLAQLDAALTATGGGPTLVVVDQFEEAFTLCPDAEQRRALFDRVLGLVPHHRVVLTMRADFWGECAQHRELAAAMEAHQKLVPPMTATELAAAMERQARRVNLRFEADLATTILEDAAREPGAMPLLQHALRELWERRHGRLLLAAEYRQVGGVAGAIAGTAEAVFAALSPADQDRVRDVFVRLARLDPEAAATGEWRDTRRRVTLDELVPADGDAEATKALVARLADARLVVVTGEGGSR